MDKVKIKRAKRNKKKLSFKEKALAGVGLTSTLVGGVAGVSRGMQEQRMVSTIKDMLTSGKKKSNTQKAKEAISKVFGIKEAKASSATINFRNLTSGNNSQVRVGESVQINITGPAGSAVFYDGGKNGSQERIYLTNDQGEQMYVGEDGTLNQTITMTADWVGDWSLDYKLFTPSEEEVFAGNVSFSVVSTATQNPGRNSANPTRVVASASSFDLKVGESKTAHVWVDYDDNSQDSEFNVETSNPNVVNFVLNQDGSFTMRAIGQGQASIIVNAKKDPSKGVRIPVRVSEATATVSTFRVTQNNQDTSGVNVNANGRTTITALATLSDGSLSPAVEVKVLDSNNANYSQHVSASVDNNGLITIQAGDPYQNEDPYNQNSDYTATLILHPILAGSNTSLDKTVSVFVERTNQNLPTQQTETKEMPAYIYQMGAQTRLEQLTKAQQEELVNWFLANSDVLPASFIPGSFFADAVFQVGKNSPTHNDGNAVRGILWGYEYQNGQWHHIFELPGKNGINIDNNYFATLPSYIPHIAAGGLAIGLGSAIVATMSTATISYAAGTAVPVLAEVVLNGVTYAVGQTLGSATLSSTMLSFQTTMHALMAQPVFVVAVVAAVILGSITLVSWLNDKRKMAHYRQDDSRLANEAFAKINKIADIYNSNALGDIDLEGEYKDRIIELMNNIFNQTSAYFKLQNSSVQSQRQYLNSAISSINQTYYQRMSGYEQGLQNIEVFEDKNGHREAYVNENFGMVVAYKDGYQHSQTGRFVGQRTVEAIRNKSNTIKIDRITFDPGWVYGNPAQGNVNPNLNPNPNPPPTNPPPVNPGPVVSPPTQDTTIYDVYLTDAGKIVWVPDYGLIIIASDGVFKADDNGNKIVSERIANFPHSLLTAINRTNNHIVDYRTPPPPATPPRVDPPPAVVTPIMNFKNISTSATLGIGVGVNNIVKVGEQWQIHLTGAEGAIVSAIGGRKTGSGFPNVMHNLGTIQTGQINLTGSFGSEDVGEWKMEIKVGENSAGFLHFTVQPQIQYASISIDTSQTLPAVVVGTTYNQTLQASGGTGPYRWAMTMGNLPSGLSLTADGKLTGTPNVSGEYNFVLNATDSVGNTTTKSFNLVVNPRIQSGSDNNQNNNQNNNNQNNNNNNQNNPIQTPVINNASVALSNGRWVLTINGANFNSSATGNLVMMNNFAVTVNSGSTNMLTAILPINMPAGSYQVFVVNSADASKISSPVTVSVPQTSNTTNNQNNNNNNQNNNTTSTLGIPSSLESYVLNKLAKSKNYNKFKTWANSTTGKATYAISGKNPTTGESFKFSVTKQQAKNIINRINAMHL